MTRQFVEARWKPIPSCPGYGASDYGRIRNDSRGTMLLGTDDRYGYRCVNIMVGGARVKRKVHRLVCEAWHGPCPEGLECAHLDSDKANNRAENLAWVSRSENQRHNVTRGAHGGGVRGERHHSAKLNYELAAEIRRKAAHGISVRALAREYGVSHQPIHDVITRKSWVAEPDAQTPSP